MSKTCTQVRLGTLLTLSVLLTLSAPLASATEQEPWSGQLTLSAPLASAEEQEPWPGHPIRLIWGAVPMQEGDWDVWKGVFDLVHHYVFSRDNQFIESVLGAAAQRGMKVIAAIERDAVVANGGDDSQERQVNRRLIRHFVRRWGDHPGLYGFVLVDTYRVPLEEQQMIYDAFKEAAPHLPFWTEYSSTNINGWRTQLNQNACDGIISYNYPCMSDDKPDRDGYFSSSVRLSVNAYREVVTKDLPIIALVQAFTDHGRYRAPWPGEIVLQYLIWEHGLGDDLAGVGFYRWRRYHQTGGNPGLLTGELPDYVWSEVKRLCYHLATRDTIWR